MKINDAGKVGSTRGSSRKKSASGDSGGFDAVLGAQTATPMTAATGVAGLASIEGLFALQEVPDATAGRSRGLARAEDMLKQLQDIQRGIALGTVSVSTLKSLAYSVRQQREQTGDPRLNEILGDIELRAEVELAKLGF